MQQRTLIAIAGVICILSGGYLLFINEGQNTSISGIMIRVGLMLLAFWLAYPTLQLEEGRKSLIWFIILFGMLFLVAARPRIAVIALLVAMVALAVNWLLRQLGQSKSGNS